MNFGWKTADPYQPVTEWIDDAVSSSDPWKAQNSQSYPPANWYEMIYGDITIFNFANGCYYAGGINQYWGISVAMSFELFTDVQVEQSKWRQDPDMDHGYDIWSWGYRDLAGLSETIMNEVADDWRCPNGKDITRIRWWGSFYDWISYDNAAVQPPSLAELPLYLKRLSCRIKPLSRCCSPTILKNV